MSEKINYYRITTNHGIEVVKTDRAEYMTTTGQTLFYFKNELNHIAPAKAMVVKIESTENILESSIN